LTRNRLYVNQIHNVNQVYFEVQLVASISTNGIAPRSGLTGLLGPGKPRPDTSGIPLSEVIGRALAEVDGTEYEPPRLSELASLLGDENYKQLVESPRIKQAVQTWANASDADRSSLAKSLAVLIADEVGRSDLENRISWEIRKLK
jgi:hypothetical protein